MVTTNILQRPDNNYFEPFWPLFLPLLGPFERFSVERTKKEKDKIEKIMGWVICRMECAQRFQVHPADIQLGFHEKGKPFFPEFPEFKFNITHGGDVIAVAFSENAEVGIDVEALHRQANLKIIERHFTANEANYLRSFPETGQMHAFLRFWTVKEAYLKMIGTGLTRPLSSFEIQELENQITIFDIGKKYPCTVFQSEADGRNIITICVESVENNFAFNQQNMKSIINFVEKNQR